MRGKTRDDSLAEIRVDGGRASACGTPLLKGEAPAVKGVRQREAEEGHEGKVLGTATRADGGIIGNIGDGGSGDDGSILGIGYTVEAGSTTVALSMDTYSKGNVDATSIGAVVTAGDFVLTLASNNEEDTTAATAYDRTGDAMGVTYKVSETLTVQAYSGTTDDSTDPDYKITDDMLQDFNIKDGSITEEGIRTNVKVGILYIQSWLLGQGAAALFNLMEDAATAEISRSQLWQWVHNNALTDSGIEINIEFIKELIDEELKEIKKLTPTDEMLDEAGTLFEDLIVNKEFEDFLTLPAYKLIN